MDFTYEEGYLALWDVNLNDYLEYIDGCIARKILSCDQEKLKSLMKAKKKQISVQGAGTKYIELTNDWSPDDPKHRVTLELASAVCAHWVLEERLNLGEDFTRNIKTPKLDDGQEITNPFASEQGIQRGTSLYYVYNYGLPFMLKNYRAQAMGLLAWKAAHKHKLLTNTNSRERFEDECDQANYEHIVGASDKGLYLDEYFESCKQDANYQKVEAYLKNVKPRIALSGEEGSTSVAHEMFIKKFSGTFLS